MSLIQEVVVPRRNRPRAGELLLTAPIDGQSIPGPERTDTPPPYRARLPVFSYGTMRVRLMT
jgi:hypothetical protein